MAEEIAAIGIDPSGAVEGAKRVNAAFASIEKASDKLARTVSSKFSKLSEATNALNKLAGPSTGAVNRLNALSSALQGFRPPNATQIKNLSGLNTQLTRMSTIKIPASIRTTLAFLGAYKGPTARSGQNAAKLFSAISNFKPPVGLKEATLNLERMANAANRASAAVANLTGRFTGLSNGGQIVFKNTNRVDQNFEQLGKRAGFLENSLFRTQHAFHALGGVLAASVIIQTASAMQGVEASLTAVTGSAAQAAVQLGFLKRTATELSIDFLTSAKSYSLFLASTKGTNFSVSETQKIFKQVSTAARALNLSVSDTEGVFRALQQIISKGSLQSEELRQQLGDRLPGAFNRMAAAIGVTTPKLQEMLKKGQVTGEKLEVAMKAFGQSLEDDFAGAIESASRTVGASFARLKNAFTFAVSDFGKGGFNELIIAVNDGLAKLLANKTVGTLLSNLAAIVGFLGQNISILASIVAGVAAAAFVKWASSITVSLTAVNSLKGAFTAIILASKGVAAGITSLSIATISSAAPVATLGRSVNAARIGMYGMGAAAYFGQKSLILFRAAAGAAALALGPLIGLLITGISLWYSFTAATDKSGEALAGMEEYTLQAAATIDRMSNDVIFNTSKLDENTDSVLRNAQAKVKAGLAQTVLDGRTVGNDVVSKTKRGFKRLFGIDDSIQPTVDAFQESIRRFSEKINQNPNYARADNKAFAADLKELRALNIDASRYIKQGKTIEEQAKRRDAFGSTLDIYNQYDAVGGALGILKLDEPTLGGATPSAETAGGGKKDKAGGGDSAVNLQRFTDSINDYKTSLKELQAVTMSGSAADAFAIKIDSEAVKTGEQAYKDYLDTISSASPARAAEATAKLTAEFNEQGIAGDDLREKFIALAKAQSLVDRKKEVTDQTTNLKLENQLLEKNISVIGKGPAAIEAMEIQSELLRVSIEKGIPLNDIVIKQYEEQLLKKQKLVAEQNYLNDLEAASRNNASLKIAIGETAAGGSTRDVADRIRLREKELELKEKYSDALKVQILLEKELENINYERALEDITKEYEAQINLADDLAEAVVGAFKTGAESGQSFLKTLKSIFKSAKDIILDFYVYQPLKEGLKKILTPNAKSGNTVEIKAVEAVEKIATASNTAVVDTAKKLGDAVQTTLEKTTAAFNSISAQQVTINAQAVNLAASSEGGNPVAALAGALSPSVASSSSNSREEEVAEIVVNGLRTALPAQAQTITSGITAGLNSQRSPFARLGSLLGISPEGRAAAQGRSERIFGKDFAQKLFGKDNPLNKLFKNAFSKDSPLGKIAETVGAVAETAGAAFASYTAVRGIAKSLGLGNTVSGALGGAAAGYQIGGPIGAAIGFTIGGILGALKKTPSAYATVGTGADGAASITSSGKRGKGKKAAAEALATGGIGIFNDFASLSGSQLLPNRALGTFGQYKKNSFFSTLGKSKKGKPLGREGIDYIYGTEDQLQIFALKKSIEGDNYSGLSQNYKTVATNSKAQTLQQFNEDLNFVKTYEGLIEATSGVPESFMQVRELLKTYETAINKARQLGLAEDKLIESRTKALAQLKKDFDYDINQQILAITDPRMAAFNDLQREYEEAVYAAAAVGGDILAVERLFGLRRTELLEETFNDAFSNLKSQAESLLKELTGSTNSPLSAIVAQGNAATEFERIRGIVTSGGNYSEVDLNSAVSNLLETSRSVYASSTAYFDIFNDVTEFLRNITTGVYTPAGSSAGAPLPPLQTAAQILDTLPIVEATNLVGEEIVRGNTTQEQLLTAILAALQGMTNGVGTSGSTTPVPGGFGQGGGAAPVPGLAELIRLGGFSGLGGIYGNIV